MDQMSDQELKHYGVVGMKWGVRKDPSKQFGKSSAKLNKKKKKLVARKEEAAKLRYKGTKLESKATSERKLKKAREKIFEAAKMDLKNAKMDKKIQKYEQKMKEAFADVPIWKISPSDAEKGKNYLYILNKDKKIPVDPEMKEYADEFRYSREIDKNKYYKPFDRSTNEHFKNDSRPYSLRSTKEQEQIRNSYNKRISEYEEKERNATNAKEERKYFDKAAALEMELLELMSE